MKIRIGFPLIESTAWTGGFNYLYNLIYALCTHQSSKVEPVLFCGEDAAKEDISTFAHIKQLQIVQTDAFNAKRCWKSLLAALFLGVDSTIEKIMRRHKIDVLFENANFYGWRLPTSTIAWFPDFQHRYLRDQFSTFSFYKRELGFRMQMLSKRTIMLSSEDARADCECFYPASIKHTNVVRFATLINTELIEDSVDEILKKYNIHQPFFFLPNQFWKHKNHILVIEALNLLKNEEFKFLVIATGNPNNPWEPDHYSKLKQRIKNMGLDSSIRLLGMVPRSHVITFMRTCIALINPSFFEGWSSTVEEARALGTPMLLSSINVHKEQMGYDAIYFNPSDSLSLAEALRSYVLSKYNGRKTRGIQGNGEQNVSRFAQDFVKLAAYAVDKENLRRLR